MHSIVVVTSANVSTAATGADVDDSGSAADGGGMK